MRLLSALLTVALTLAVIFAAIYWVAPIALSFYAARKALPIARVVPTDLRDLTASQSAGTKLSYFGYEFEVPWTDLDESKTKLYPENRPDKNRVVLTFHCGLRLQMTALPEHEFANEFTGEDFKMSPQKVEAVFGRGTSKSDYQFVKNVYEFTPDRMHYWSLSPGVHYREDIVLMIKSIMPTRAANSGIFRIQNQSCKGFQQGNPGVRQNSFVVDLYSDDGGVDFIFDVAHYNNPIGLTQPEINRVVQSLHKISPSSPLAQR